MASHILAIDQGTTSTRSVVYDDHLRPLAKVNQEFPLYYPASGLVEQDGEEIFASVLATGRRAIEKSGIDPTNIASIGITNQRETILMWERATGKLLHRAIVWQDRRTSAICDEIRPDEAFFMERTGLRLDPYFSGTKVRWLLDHLDPDRNSGEDVCIGTIDTWLIWKLTGGKHHLTDATNASRTLFYDLNLGEWSPELCERLTVPLGILPEIRDCADDFGTTEPSHFGAAIPILGVAGDQHAATLGQACFQPGMIKSTYGTGCFMVYNTGDRLVPSKNRLLTVLAYRMNGKPTYGLEGSIFVAGAAVQWLRDGLGIIDQASRADSMARDADDGHHPMLVPAFVGLGAPYWDPDCRGILAGLTRNSGPNELARAALEAAGFQTRDLIQAMEADLKNAGVQFDAGSTSGQRTIRVDGGMAASDYAMQFLASITGTRVEAPQDLESTSLGAAWLAGSRAGIVPGQDEFAASWQSRRSFGPNMDVQQRTSLTDMWAQAIQSTLSRHRRPDTSPA